MPTPLDPRDIRRLAALQAELDALKKSSGRLASEHRQLQKKLTETQDALLAAEQVKARYDRALSEFDKAASTGLIVRPEETSVAAFAQAAAAALADAASRLEEAENRAEQLTRELEDLREIGTDDAALERAREKLESLREETEARAEEDRARIRELEEALDEALKSVPAIDEADDVAVALLGENRRLAEEVEGLSGDLRAFEDRLAEADGRAETARRDAEDKMRDHFEGVISELRRREAVAQKQLAHATAQLKSEGREPIISAERVSMMMEDLLQEVGAHLPGLRVAEGELRLKVGFGSAGDATGFVIPTAGGEAREYDGLGEILLRFEGTPRKEDR